MNEKTIVICKSDKDGKTIIVNYDDYIDIMTRELKDYNQMNLKNNKMEKWLTETKTEAEEMILELHESGDVDEEMLYCATGIKRNKNNKLCRMTGPQAKHFANLETGYTYPLFKTHKLNVEQVMETNIKEIPVRLVQSSGNSFLSRITALLEFLLKPVSKLYCSKGVNEYCKDSEHYLKDLMQWKNKSIPEQELEHYKIVAADVKALYPSLKRELVQMAVEDALQSSSKITRQGQKCITKLVMFCLSHSVIQFQNRTYLQSTGIVTGENNSVTIANIALHYVIQSIPEINTKTKIFRRFIDDIIFITKDNEDAGTIKSKLTKKFDEFDLKLTYREVSTNKEGERVEFLDVLHCTSHESTKINQSINQSFIHR